jgi:hypothetical protein
VGFDEQDVLLDTAGVDLAFVTVLDAAEPGRVAPAPGSDVEVVAVADDPDGHRPPQRVVPSHRGELRSSAAAIFVSSSLVHAVICTSPP